ncbi:hypothetical protein [Chitinilyticum litopenaei]|uniref:hypothetical protein n=1 Tax=Chitinilyticum litopenaei TaxID=1121276 RepID=UPI00042686EB|nr:hypothetical protein [Chitinilyticum litopenaei]
MKTVYTVLAMTLAALSAGALADDAMAQLSLNCSNNPKALKHALERKARDADKVRFVISGECHGPLTIERSGVEIIGDNRQPATLRVLQAAGESAAILVQSASVKLGNFTIAVPAGMGAVKAQANATVSIDRITTNAQSDWSAPRAQYVVTDSSSLFLANQTGADVLVIGASSADFAAGNSGVVLDVRDTSAAKSSGSGNHFQRVQLSASGYLLADNKARIDALAIWGKSAAEITRESAVGQLDMGGQTLFAAYGNSSVSGPYGIYGNVVLELSDSTATCWKALDKPHSIFVGNNARVNGTVYPGWTWAGQDGNATDCSASR